MYMSMHLSWDCFNLINKCNYSLSIKILTILFLVCCKWTIEEQVNTRGPVKRPLQYDRHEELVVTLAFHHIRAEKRWSVSSYTRQIQIVDGSQDGLKDIAWTARRTELTLTGMGKWPEEPFRERGEMGVHSSTFWHVCIKNLRYT